ncbi:MAG TPA: hypothetical protein VIM75_18035 [Ohtaekwangia sp.]|uniref:hypothetical protein n=1 Tax=Ohtaekwangia sp. TaxID=2066019 RepID=UPI002F92D465
MKPKIKTYRLVSSVNLFRISLIVIALTMLGVYFWGLGTHHTFFENSMWSITILSAAFFWFTSAGLYKGIKLRAEKVDIPIIPADKITFTDSITGTPHISFDFLDVDDGEGSIAGIILSIILWLLVAVLLAGLLLFFCNAILFVIAAFMGMLYWVFFRALRLVFRHSHKTKGDLSASILTAAAYTVLYNFWIYGIFIATAFLKH